MLPVSGKNYRPYSHVAVMSGRTYVHSIVKRIIVLAYKDLETEQKQKVYKYAETGFEYGGQFKPHKTHQNGLSVDFIVPVLNQRGQSVYLPTHALNKWGYAIKFNSKGRYKKYQIDFEAMAAHIVALHKQANKSGVGIWRVIFDPGLQGYLFKTRYGQYLRQNVKFSRRRSWVRHDEHYHIDFSIKCKRYSRR